MEKSPDGKALDELARSGSDLSKLHHIDFFLNFPTQKAAEGAQLRLEGLAFATKIERAKTGEGWRVQGAKRMYPVESDLIGLRDKLEAIAGELHGTYEGWRAKAVE